MDQALDTIRAAGVQYEHYLELAEVTTVSSLLPAGTGLPEFYAPAPAPLTLTITTR